MEDAWKTLCGLLRESGAVLTFSPNCISGIVETCYCCRCMKVRGEVPTEETEAIAALRSKSESRAFRDRMTKPLADDYRR